LPDQASFFASASALTVFAAAIDIRLFNLTPQRVLATPNFWRDGYNCRRLIGIFMFVFQNHPNCAGAHFSRISICSVTFSIGSTFAYFGASGKQGTVTNGL
jgi:hypothetical protein